MQAGRITKNSNDQILGTLEEQKFAAVNFAENLILRSALTVPRAIDTLFLSRVMCEVL
jgi:hypothetical protein